MSRSLRQNMDMHDARSPTLESVPGHSYWMEEEEEEGWGTVAACDRAAAAAGARALPSSPRHCLSLLACHSEAAASTRARAEDFKRQRETADFCPPGNRLASMQSTAVSQVS